MLTPARSSALRAVPLFAACTDQELAEVDMLIDEIEVETGEVVIREGEAGEETFVILEGQAEVTARGRRLAGRGPGEFFGEMAVLAGGPRSATVTAATPMRLVVVGKAALSSLLDVGGVARVMLRTIVERMRAAQDDVDLSEPPTP
jgi:CRP-like cAMP-binding protein